jgi:PTH1 family peptidyl-tRNA hydrolase
MDSAIRLVVGLGNPGREHDATRHNAGFWFVDALAARLSCALVAEGRFTVASRAPGPICGARPGTYMNLSGRAGGAVALLRSRRTKSWSRMTSSTCLPARRR